MDARNADGSYALDVNEIKHGSTVLDEAYQTQNQEIIRLLEARGARRSNGLPQFVPVAPMPAVVVPPPAAPTGNVELDNFNQDRQNTHDPNVTHSVKGSLLGLNKMYGVTLDENKMLQEFE